MLKLGGEGVGVVRPECNDHYTFFFIIFQLFSPIFGQISHIFGGISGEKNNFSLKCSKKGLVFEKNELVFCYTFQNIGGMGVRPECNKCYTSF